MDLVYELTDVNFETEISQGVCLVDFNAAWCGPCRMLSPIVEEVAKEMEHKAKVAKLDIDSEQKTAAKYQVTSVPTLIIFKDGKEEKRLVGLRDKEEIEKELNTLI